MLKKQMMLTPAQKKANARNQLFRQIHGYNLTPFINRANAEKAITDEEDILLREIMQRLILLKSYQFENSKKVGLNARRRCSNCNGIARWKVTILGQEQYCCNKHKEQAERYNKQSYKGEWMVTNIRPIDPNK